MHFTSTQPKPPTEYLTVKSYPPTQPIKSKPTMLSTKLLLSTVTLAAFSSIATAVPLDTRAITHVMLKYCDRSPQPGIKDQIGSWVCGGSCHIFDEEHPAGSIVHVSSPGSWCMETDGNTKFAMCQGPDCVNSTELGYIFDKMETGSFSYWMPSSSPMDRFTIYYE